MARQSDGTKYVMMVVVVVAIGYVAMNPGMLSIQEPTVPAQTYSGSTDVSTTTYYELKRTDDYTWSTGGESYSVSMWANPNYTTGDYETGVLDDIQVYNYEISNKELNYLYLTDNSDLDESSGWSMQWNHNGSELYLDGSQPYSCDEWDVSTCTQTREWDTNNVPNSVVVTGVTESDELPKTSIWDYLFK